MQFLVQVSTEEVFDGGKARHRRRRADLPFRRYVVGRLLGYNMGGNVVVRCRQGHLFSTLWIPGVKLKAVDLGVARFQYCPVGKHWSLVMPVRDSALTEAELRVLRLTPTHLTLEEIGHRLCLSRNTVKTHLKGIYAKLNVASRGEAVARAQALGLLGRDGHRT